MRNNVKCWGKKKKNYCGKLVSVFSFKSTIMNQASDE